VSANIVQKEVGEEEEKGQLSLVFRNFHIRVKRFI